MEVAHLDMILNPFFLILVPPCNIALVGYLVVSLLTRFTMADFACPSCGKSDCVKKITGIVSQDLIIGKQTGTIAGSTHDARSFGSFKGTIHQTSTEASALAMKLQPPQEPSYQSPWSRKSGFLVGFLSLMVI